MIQSIWNWFCSWNIGYINPVANGVVAIILTICVIGLAIDGLRGKKSFFF
jgi:hypothetical protein